MKTKSEHVFTGRQSEHGNALIYVLIAIVLFAALSFTLQRQTDTGEAGTLSQERAELYATQLIGYASDAKSVYDKMEFSGTRLGDIDVIPPSDADFNTAPTINKIYHPDGGGLNPGRLPDDVIDDSSISTPGDPAAGWYLGFNDVDWTTVEISPGVTSDLILTAYGISPLVCGLINEKITGTTNIPTVGDSLKETLIQRVVDGEENFTTGANTDLTTGTGNLCVECENRASLCVQEGGIYAFYSILAER